MANNPDYYEVLQVSPNAEEDIIQVAYRRLALKWHPDRRPGDPSASQQMKLLNEANEVLSHPQRRREYDMLRQSATSRSEATRQTAEHQERAEEKRKREEENQRQEDQRKRTGPPSPTEWQKFSLAAGWFVCLIGMAVLGVTLGPVGFVVGIILLVTYPLWGRRLCGIRQEEGENQKREKNQRQEAERKSQERERRQRDAEAAERKRTEPPSPSEWQKIKRAGVFWLSLFGFAALSAIFGAVGVVLGFILFLAGAFYLQKREEEKWF